MRASIPPAAGRLEPQSEGRRVFRAPRPGVSQALLALDSRRPRPLSQLLADRDTASEPLQRFGRVNVAGHVAQLLEQVPIGDANERVPHYFDLDAELVKRCLALRLLLLLRGAGGFGVFRHDELERRVLRVDDFRCPRRSIHWRVAPWPPAKLALFDVYSETPLVVVNLELERSPRAASN